MEKSKETIQSVPLAPSLPIDLWDFFQPEEIHGFTKQFISDVRALIRKHRNHQTSRENYWRYTFRPIRYCQSKYQVVDREANRQHFAEDGTVDSSSNKVVLVYRTGHWKHKPSAHRPRKGTDEMRAARYKLYKSLHPAIKSGKVAEKAQALDKLWSHLNLLQQKLVNPVTGLIRGESGKYATAHKLSLTPHKTRANPYADDGYDYYREREGYSGSDYDDDEWENRSLSSDEDDDGMIRTDGLTVPSNEVAAAVESHREFERANPNLGKKGMSWLNPAPPSSRSRKGNVKVV